MPKYVSFDNINASGANIRIMYSMRSNGKTYALKQEFLRAYQRGRKFFYLRRRATEVRPSRLKFFFADFPYEDYLPEGYRIGATRGEFYMYNIENGREANKQTIGYYGSLDKANELKSTTYTDVDILGYDEFLSSRLTGTELIDEYTLFINTISTIRRTRKDFVVYMLGNTVNRNSCYFYNWGINIDDITFGSIKVYEYSDNNRICVEYPTTDIDESNKLFVFGTPKEQAIINGVWETSAYPTYPDNKNIAATFQILLIAEGKRVYVCEDSGNIYCSATSFPAAFSTTTISRLRTNPAKRIYHCHTLVGQTFVSRLHRLFDCNHIYFDRWTTGDTLESIFDNFRL